MANPLDPFNRNSPKPFVPESDSSAKQPEARYVIQRREDSKFADESHRPTAKVQDAEVFPSKPIAAIWADKMSAGMPGTWEAQPHPGVPDPEDDNYDPAKADAMYGALGKRAA